MARITKDTQNDLLAALIPLAGLLPKAWREFKDSKPATDPTVVDSETEEPVETAAPAAGPTFNAEDGDRREVQDILQAAMRNILPVPAPLPTLAQKDGGPERVAWNIAEGQLVRGKDFLVWGFCHVVLMGFTLADKELHELIPAMDLAAKRAVLDWHGVPDEEAPASFRDAVI